MKFGNVVVKMELLNKLQHWKRVICVMVGDMFNTDFEICHPQDNSYKCAIKNSEKLKNCAKLVKEHIDEALEDFISTAGFKMTINNREKK